MSNAVSTTYLGRMVADQPRRITTDRVSGRTAENDIIKNTHQTPTIFGISLRISYSAPQ
jgi:hypothetical protein